MFSIPNFYLKFKTVKSTIIHCNNYEVSKLEKDAGITSCEAEEHNEIFYLF